MLFFVFLKKELHFDRRITVKGVWAQFRYRCLFREFNSIITSSYSLWQNIFAQRDAYTNQL